LLFRFARFAFVSHVLLSFRFCFALVSAEGDARDGIIELANVFAIDGPTQIKRTANAIP
jgi:hypothetical protein